MSQIKVRNSASGILFVLHLLCIVKLCSPKTLDQSVLKNESFWIPRVVNGVPADLGDVPYQVALKKSLKYGRIYFTSCGAAIIGPSKLLSAAHCFKNSKSTCSSCCSESVVLEEDDESLRDRFAVAGSLYNKERYNQYNQTQWRKIRTVIYPVTYEFPEDDIAVVMLRKPFVFNSYVQPIAYAKGAFREYAGDCLVSGYGRVSQTSKSEKLLMASLRLLPHKVCSMIMRKNARKFICTSSVASDTGKGDSGGPLVCSMSDKAVLIGIVSGKRFSATAEAKKGGTFFTRVSHYSKYIDRNNEADRQQMIAFYFYYIALLNCLH